MISRAGWYVVEGSAENVACGIIGKGCSAGVWPSVWSGPRPCYNTHNCYSCFGEVRMKRWPVTTHAYDCTYSCAARAGGVDRVAGGRSSALRLFAPVAPKGRAEW